MNKEERLVLLGCLSKRTEEEQNELEDIINDELDWGKIVGILVHHRLSGYFYIGVGKLNNHMTQECAKTLRLITESQKIISKKKFELMLPILKELEKNNVNYACLKGLIYELEIYELGARRSNDCDILVWENDLEKVDTILRKQGFIQSEDAGLTEASRRSKLIQRMNYHDLIPYFRKIDDFPLQKKLKIDINFHIDGKDNDITKQVIDFGTRELKYGDESIRGLNKIGHFIQLCIHFYREATNTIWINKRRDILLYKIIDVVNTYRNMSREEIVFCYETSKEFNVVEQLYFTLEHINMFYPKMVDETILKLFDSIDKSFMSKIVVEGLNKVIEKDYDYAERAFDLKYKGMFF